MVQKKRAWKVCRPGRLTALALAGAAAVSLAACGGGSGDGTEEAGENSQTNGVSAPEYVYVPEFAEIEAEFYNEMIVNDALYYTTSQENEETGAWENCLMRHPLEGGEDTRVPLQLDALREQYGDINYWQVLKDGSVCALLQNYQYDEESGTESVTHALAKFDASGSPVLVVDITADFQGDGQENLYPYGICADSQGRFYLTGEKIWFYDAEGNAAGTINAPDWISDLCTGPDGKVYIQFYSQTKSREALAVLDFEAKSIGEPLKDTKGNAFVAGTEGTFISYDDSSVYLYDLTAQKSEKLFDWVDSDINGSYVDAVSVLEDGRFAVYYSDWETSDSGLAFLTKTPSSQVAAKEYILLGTLISSNRINASAVAFNKTSDKYRVVVKEYFDENVVWTETSYSDAVTRMLNDITSGNCPDLIALEGINVDQMANKGVFEDLSPYLEQSQTLDRADMMDNALAALTFGEVLVSIPGSFTLNTLIGKGEMVGQEPGWTLEDMVALADAHPDKDLFHQYGRIRLLQDLLNYNMSRYINWQEGSCSFDSKEFQDLLSFAARFPDDSQIDWGSDASEPGRVSKGEVLLCNAVFSDFDEFQMYEEAFQGDAVCIGFPNPDKESGAILYVVDSPIGISARSAVKEGAWAFLESYVSSGNRYGFGFPNSRKKIQKMAQEAVEVSYVTYDNGQLALDEEGNPIEESFGTVSYGSDWTYQYRRTTQEEVDTVFSLIETAKPSSYGTDEQIWNIISEEAEPFFQGQKSVEEAAGIIQRRIGNYIDENG